MHFAASRSWILVTCVSLAACGSGGSPNSSPVPQGGMSTAGGTGGSAGPGTGGSAGTVSSTAGTAPSGGVPAVGGTTGGTAVVGGSSSGSGGGAVGGGGSGSGGTDPLEGGFTDPGTEGDGDFTIKPPYKASPLNQPMGATFGKQIMFTMASADSTIYPGRNGAYSRKVWLYVPAKYVPGTKAPFMVIQDGYFAIWFGNDLPHNPNPNGPNLPGTANIPLIIDNLVEQGKLPPIAVLFVDNGGGDGGNSQRGLEYDTVSGKYAGSSKRRCCRAPRWRPRRSSRWTWCSPTIRAVAPPSAAAPVAPRRFRWRGFTRITSRG